MEKYVDQLNLATCHVIYFLFSFVLTKLKIYICQKKEKEKKKLGVAWPPLLSQGVAKTTPKTHWGLFPLRVNQWVLEFNSKVKNLVASLNGRLPNAKLIFADTYSGVLDLIENPSACGKPRNHSLFGHETCQLS